MSFSGGAAKSSKTRPVSAPNLVIMSSALTTLPLDFDIFAPSRMISPCARNFVNGSSKPMCPMSWSTIVRNREYSRWSTACSLPPMYECTGSQFRVTSGSNGLLAAFAARNPSKTAIADLDQGTSIAFGDLERIVTDIASVSGGSIVAAHLVLNWDRYVGDDAAAPVSRVYRVFSFAKAEALAKADAAGKPALEAQLKKVNDEKAAARKAELKAIEWKPLWGKPAIFAGIIMLVFLALFRNPAPAASEPAKG